MNDPNAEKVDMFEDIMNADDAGSLEGLGRKDYDSIRESGPSKDGIQLVLNCRRCNKRHGVLIEWKELFWVGSNGAGQPLLLPPGWMYSPRNGSAFPNLTCSKCGNEGIAPHYTPQRAAALIKQADTNIIPRKVLQGWAQEVARARGG